MNHDNVPSTGLSMLFMETIHMSICFEGLIFGQKGILNHMDADARCMMHFLCVFCAHLLHFFFLLAVVGLYYPLTLHIRVI